jgi:hypothetical protein
VTGQREAARDFPLLSDNGITPGLSWTAMGGGIANLGTASLVRSTLRGNKAHPKVISTWGGVGGGIFNAGDLLVDSSLISKNIADGDYFGLGGGICNGFGLPGYTDYPGGNVTIIDSTLTENLVYSDGDSPEYPGDSRGGGISSENGGTVVLRSSTIARNKSDAKSSFDTAKGGGLSNQGSMFDLRNTINALNTAKTAAPDLSGTVGELSVQPFRQ